MLKHWIIAPLAILAAGCTVHPAGEKPPRSDAAKEGATYQLHTEQRNLPPLPDKPNVDDLVHYALLSNADLEQKFWEWKSAIEQIPQDGTQSTNLLLSAGVPIMNGSSAFDRTVVTASNDPMGDLVLPPKLSTARDGRSIDARAAGIRFQKAKFELRNKVISAYVDYVLVNELIKLEQSNLELLKTVASASEALEPRRNGGAAGSAQGEKRSRSFQQRHRADAIADRRRLRDAQRAAGQGCE